MKRLLISLLSLVALVQPAFTDVSICKKFPAELVKGTGTYPYNYRIIDNIIHAGGHPLNPATNFENTDEQVLAIINYLKSCGVNTIVNLEDTKRIRHRYKSLLKQANVKVIHIPMSATKFPNESQWQEINMAMNSPVYIHCKWGADRTGAVIARYLIEKKGYSSKEAFEAVITNGSHSGVLGGLKTYGEYINLIKFFWPNYPNP